MSLSILNYTESFCKLKIKNAKLKIIFYGVTQKCTEETQRYTESFCKLKIKRILYNDGTDTFLASPLGVSPGLTFFPSPWGGD